MFTKMTKAYYYSILDILTINILTNSERTHKALINNLFNKNTCNLYILL